MVNFKIDMYNFTMDLEFEEKINTLISTAKLMGYKISFDSEWIIGYFKNKVTFYITHADGSFYKLNLYRNANFNVTEMDLSFIDCNLGSKDVLIKGEDYSEIIKRLMEKL